MSEKREHLRIPVTVKVQLKGEDQQDEIYFTENLSKGGFLMKTKTPPFVGTTFKAQISLPQVQDLIQAKCEVIWRQEGVGCGVRFLIITKPNEALLEKFLDQQ